MSFKCISYLPHQRDISLERNAFQIDNLSQDFKVYTKSGIFFLYL